MCRTYMFPLASPGMVSNLGLVYTVDSSMPSFSVATAKAWSEALSFGLTVVLAAIVMASAANRQAYPAWAPPFPPENHSRRERHARLAPGDIPERTGSQSEGRWTMEFLTELPPPCSSYREKSSRSRERRLFMPIYKKRKVPKRNDIQLISASTLILMVVGQAWSTATTFTCGAFR